MLAYPVFEDEPVDSPTRKWLDRATRGVLKSALASGEFKPELHQTLRIHRPSGLKARRLLLVGAGVKDKFNLARLREIAGTAVRGAHAAACRTLAFARTDNFPAGESVRVIAEGALYGDYESDTYKTRDREGRYLENFVLISEARLGQKEVKEGIRRGTIIGEATSFARNLANEPANILTPSQFADRAAAVADKSGLDLQVLEREDMDKLGMNTLLAVSRGSDEPPKLMILRIMGQEKKSQGPLFAFIGKGVTFDSGGISIKPAEKMEDMKADMAGGAAVLGAMVALGQLAPRQRVIGLIPAVENLPGGRATKPGDVVKSYLGKTVEIINTDAEGRLILADTIAYSRKLGADHIVDVATLTGACVIALGMVNAGMFGTDDRTMERLRRNCSVTGEKLWQLPLDEEYRKAIRSEIADIKNVGNRWAGAITAAKFLQEFAEDTPWVHLDIAGMDLDHEGRPFACKGATGFGVRTLVQLLT
jgi:leucyl aminopeptidase